MARRLSLSLATACAVLLPMPVAANTATCADRTLVAEALMERFGEAYAHNASSADGQLLEVFANEARKTWTILVTLPERDLSCLLASGTGEGPLERELASLEN